MSLAGRVAAVQLRKNSSDPFSRSSLITIVIRVSPLWNEKEKGGRTICWSHQHAYAGAAGADGQVEVELLRQARSPRRAAVGQAGLVAACAKPTGSA